MDKNYITFNKKRYALNLNKFKEICMEANPDNNSKQIEISQVYEKDGSPELSLSSKVEHETRLIGNTQSDMITYEVVKLMIISLLEEGRTEKEYSPSLSSSLSINTLLSWGILEEL